MSASNHPPRDPYLAYIERFFGRWLPFYDLFALSIAPVYRAAARLAVPAPAPSLLDVCTGTGELALRCARRGAVVTGVDTTPAMLARARRKAGGLPLTFHAMDARRLDFPDRSFDVVTLSLALHDMPARVRGEVLSEVRRVARERVVVVDYDFIGPRWVRRAAIAAINAFETHYFGRFAAEGGAEPVLVQAGLRELRVRRPLPPPFAIWTARP